MLRYVRGWCWRFGSLEVWGFGSLEVWEFGGLGVWKFGGLEVWRFGSLEVWLEGKMRTYSFEKLSVWQESRDLVKSIYQLSAKFPPEEKYGLMAQIRSAAISISSNIAEGAGRKYPKEQKQFYSIAYASLMEVLNQLILAGDLGFLEEVSIDQEFRPLIESISLKLYKMKS